jgi:hypothetical protein
MGLPATMERACCALSGRDCRWMQKDDILLHSFAHRSGDDLTAAIPQLRVLNIAFMALSIRKSCAGDERLSAASVTMATFARSSQVCT